MNFTEQEVLEYVKQEDVRFIRLAFVDVFGRQKNIAILPGELERAFRYGIAIDASAIAGFGGEVRSDLCCTGKNHGQCKKYCSDGVLAI